MLETDRDFLWIDCGELFDADESKEFNDRMPALHASRRAGRFRIRTMKEEA